MFNWLRKNEPVVPTMSDDDKITIHLFARGDNQLREEAIEIYHKYMPTLGPHGCGYPEMDFMSEVDNPCTDLMLRSRYREQVLAQNN